jgi:hypothetical protein
VRFRLDFTDAELCGGFRLRFSTLGLSSVEVGPSWHSIESVLSLLLYYNSMPLEAEYSLPTACGNIPS